MMDDDIQQRAAQALASLSATMPTQDQVLAGVPLPEWMAATWLAALTDPGDPKFSAAVVKAEAWLADH